MSTDPRFFRVFLSSPGDVPQERDDAEAVIQELNDSGEFGHHFHLKLFRWDDKAVVLPMPVTDIPQKAVDVYMTLPSACDLVVVLFWARMGTPLVMDERDYLSGTHYEYSEALQGYQQHGKPTVWLYRCAEEPFVSQKDPQRDEKNRQFDLVEQFFRQFQDADGRYTGGVNAYATHADFKALFKGQLLTYLRHLRDNPRMETPVHPTKDRFTGIPYRGLTALDETDAPIFFGREAETLAVQSRVENKPLVMVLGASGSGKSSLVGAGVLPKLRQRGWKIVRCVPGEDPFYNLGLALVSQLPELDVKPTAYLPEARKLADSLRERPENVAQQLALTLPEQRILLFIDQFEEVFTLADKNPRLKPDEVSIFLQAVQWPAPGLTTLITLRADFYGVALPHFEALKQETYGLTRPSVFALYELITRPAEVAGLKLDTGLAQRVVDEAGNESGALALIAYVMEALYLRAKVRHDNCLTWADYEALDGVRGAINTLANQAYAVLPLDEAAKQAALQTVFRELIALTEEDGQLIPTRRRAALALFAAGSNEARLIEAFVKARLLVADSQCVEVAHEAILRHWQELAAWIGRVKGDLALYRQYERDARVWADRGRDTPPPTHEALVYFYNTLDSLGLQWGGLPEPLKAYTEREADRLLRELDDLHTTHKRRYDIGERLWAIGDTRDGVGVRTNGIPDIEWLLVAPGGEISLEGVYQSDGEDEPEESPRPAFGRLSRRASFVVQPFYIARYLITYAQFQVFVEAEDGFQRDKWWAGMPKEYHREELSTPPSQGTNYPRGSVSWYQSVAFCRWLSARYQEHSLFEPFQTQHSGLSTQELEIRLPLEWEWQWAAQGGAEARSYPWGEWDRYPRANTTEAGIGNRSTAVGMYPHGVAACGALDMAGNLWEWCLNDYDNPRIIDYGNVESKVLRGGSVDSYLHNATCAFRLRDNPFDIYNPNGGFRVVLAAPIASLKSVTLTSGSE